MKFFAIASSCLLKCHAASPLIAFDEEGEFIPIYRTKELAEMEMSNIDLDDVQSENLSVREFEVNAI